MRIYLAGGMHRRPVEQFREAIEAIDPLTTAPKGWFARSFPDGEVAWADLVKFVLPHHEVFDPRVNNTKVFEDYSFLDLLELRRSELIIAYLEAANPSGMGLAGEIAYAKGLGKTVLLINEKDDRYTRFIENFADRVFHSLRDAVPVISRIRP